MNAYCFLCSRCTDHSGEHDALVDEGLAEYETDAEGYWTGTVLKTEFYHPIAARIISEIDYWFYKQSFGF
jgi:hypothetical protein